MRCKLHKGQKSLENALAADERCQALIDNLITAYAGDDADGQNLGSLARGLRNSCKFQKIFCAHTVEAMENLHSTLSKMVSFRFAPQRFDTVLEVARLVILHVKPLIQSLVHLKLADPKKVAWCSRMLKCFSGPNLVLLAFICELAASASRFHHRYDDPGAKPSMIARTGEWFQGLVLELNKLFFFDHGEPLVFSAEYSGGFTQMLQQSYNLLVSECIIADGKICFYRNGFRTPEHLRRSMAKELGSIQNVVKAYQKAIDPGDCAVASSLRPFDVEYWQQHFNDDALSLGFIVEASASGICSLSYNLVSM